MFGVLSVLRTSLASAFYSGYLSDLTLREIGLLPLFGRIGLYFRLYTLND